MSVLENVVFTGETGVVLSSCSKEEVSVIDSVVLYNIVLVVLQGRAAVVFSL